MPATDLDFVLVEYDRARPAAIVEYKHERALVCNAYNTSIAALRVLADGAAIPLFVAQYNEGFTRWTVLAINRFAAEWTVPRDAAHRRAICRALAVRTWARH
jgi:hypothetical protein